MGKGAPLRWLENRLLARHLRGRGVEIGALWRQFPVPRRARVWYVDRETGQALADHYGEQYGKVVPPHLVAEAAALPVAAGSLNFIIASHVLEHLPFPLAGLRGWYEALAPGGALVLRVPDLRYSFDARRARTRLAHLVEEFEHPERFDRHAHYAEFVEKVYNQKPGDPGFEPLVEDLIRKDYSIHFHAWTDADLREIIEFTREKWRLEWEARIFWGAHFYRKEAVALLVRHS